MMYRPILKGFRVVSFSSYNKGAGATKGMELTIQREISVGLGVTKDDSTPSYAVVLITINAVTSAHDDADSPRFQAEYHATFEFPSGAKSESIDAYMKEEASQYALASQAVPCAMLHFKRELLATGLDARHIEIGL